MAIYDTDLEKIVFLRCRRNHAEVIRVQIMRRDPVHKLVTRQFMLLATCHILTNIELTYVARLPYWSFKAAADE